MQSRLSGKLSTVQTLFLTGFLAALKNQELSEEEQRLISENLNAPEILEFLMLMAAVHRRTGTLDFLSSLNASSESIKQWITKQTISNICTQDFKDHAIPAFDSVFDSAISMDDANYLEFLAAISYDIRGIIIDKLIALPTETKLKLTKIKEKVVALNQDIEPIIQKRDKVTRFAHAIISGDLSYIRSVTCDFDRQFTDYFILLAASHQQTDALKELIESKKFPLEAVEHWAHGAPTPLPDYCPFKIENDYKATLLQAIHSANLDFLKQMKPFLQNNMSESTKLDLTLAATTADNPEMLNFLTKELACILEPKDYSWTKEHSRVVTRTYGGFYDKPTTKEETVYPDAKEDITYRNTLLAAANKQKLKALEWLLLQPFQKYCKTRYLERCHEMANTRPHLKEFFDARHKKFFNDMTSLCEEEIGIYSQSIKTDDEGLNAFVTACESGTYTPVAWTLSALHSQWIRHHGLNYHPVKEKDRKRFGEELEKANKEDPFEQWLMKQIEALFLRSDPRISRLLNCSLERFTYEYESRFTRKLYSSIKILQEENLKLSQIVKIKDKFCQGSPIPHDDLTFLIKNLSTTKFVNELNLVRPILESILKDDDLRVFYALFLTANDNNTRTFASCYHGNASTCLVEAAKAGAVNIFKAIHAAFGNNALDSGTRYGLRRICDDAHPKIKSILLDILSLPVPQQPQISFFPALSAAEETFELVVEKKI